MLFCFPCYIKITQFKIFICSFSNKKMLFKKKESSFLAMQHRLLGSAWKKGCKLLGCMEFRLCRLLTFPYLPSLGTGATLRCLARYQTAWLMHTSRLSVYGQSQTFLQLVSFLGRTDLTFCLLHGMQSVFYALINFRQESVEQKNVQEVSK